MSRWALLIVFVIVGGCAEPFAEVRTRAAFDFGCNEEHLTLTEVAKNTVAAEGCGRRAAYVRLCDGYNCTWVYNSPGVVTGNR
jgi:hypothetical protein